MYDQGTCTKEEYEPRFNVDVSLVHGARADPGTSLIDDNLLPSPSTSPSVSQTSSDFKLYSFDGMLTDTGEPAGFF